MISKSIRFVSIAASIFFLACGGGGAATDSTEAEVNPPDEIPTPPGGTPSSNVVAASGTTFAPRVVNIAPGGSVTWQFSGSRHNVTFGSQAPAGGSIPDTESGNSATRVFGSAGTYDYQCTRHDGMTGQIVVGAPGSTPTEPPPTSGTLVLVTSSGYSPERAEIAPGELHGEFSQSRRLLSRGRVTTRGNMPQTRKRTRCREPSCEATTTTTA